MNQGGGEVQRESWLEGRGQEKERGTCLEGVFRYRARLLHVEAETYMTWHSGLGRGVIMKEDSDLSGLAKI